MYQTSMATFAFVRGGGARHDGICLRDGPLDALSAGPHEQDTIKRGLQRHRHVCTPKMVTSVGSLAPLPILESTADIRGTAGVVMSHGHKEQADAHHAPRGGGGGHLVVILRAPIRKYRLQEGRHQHGQQLAAASFFGGGAATAPSRYAAVFMRWHGVAAARRALRRGLPAAGGGGVPRAGYAGLPHHAHARFQSPQHGVAAAALPTCRSAARAPPSLWVRVMRGGGPDFPAGG